MDKDKILSMINPKIFARITDYSFGPNDISTAFRIFKETLTVIAPGSDMPFVLLKYVGPLNYNPVNGDGWPAQAANPGAYISNLDIYQSEDIRNPLGMAVANAPILLSNVPVLLKPGVYIPALPMIAYCGGQWDFHHAWPVSFQKPVIRLMESNTKVEKSNYGLYTTQHDASIAVTDFTPWLLSMNERIYSLISGLNRAVYGTNFLNGAAQVAIARFDLYVKKSRPDTAISTYYDLYCSIGGPLGNGGSAIPTGVPLKLNWDKAEMTYDLAGSSPGGCLYTWE